MDLTIQERVKLGKNPRIDPSAVLGYLPSRKVADLMLVIGDDANIRSGTVIYAGSRIGNNLETGHNVVIREENRIGDHLSIWSNSVIDYGCVLGHRVKVHCNCYVAQYTTISDGSFLSPGVIVANDKYPGSPHSMERLKGPEIGRNVKIGINSTILPGVKIGDDALVGAGSVVTKDVPSRAVVWGNPARVTKLIDSIPEYSRGR